MSRAYVIGQSVPDVSGLRSRLILVARWLLRQSETSVVLALIVLVVGFRLKAPAFGTYENLRQIASDAATSVILGVGSTFVIISAGIDLSIGSVLVFSGVIAARIIQTTGDDLKAAVLALFGAMLAGTMWGVLNGILVARLRINPLIATLGTLGAALGGAEIVTGGADFRDVPLSLIEGVGNGKLFGFSYLLLIALAIAVAAWVILSCTRFGYHTYAIGSNAEAARRAGVRVERQLIEIYALSGFLAGLAGFLSLARFGTTSIAGHQLDNLNAITGVVLGGTSLFGGVGTIFGTVLGTMLPQVINSGLIIAGVQVYWQQVAVAVVLIVAVYVDQLRRRARERV